MELEAIFITLKLAFISTMILLLLGTPLAWWLAMTRSRVRSLAASIVALPLVLPPIVLGFYLLLCLGPQGPIGGLTDALGLGSLAFSFSGLVLGSVIYSLPFVVGPIQSAFEAMGNRPLWAAATLGAPPLSQFFRVAIPMAKPGILTASVLGFAHTVGEFGVVLMIGGNIPGKTRVVSLAIYEQVESGDYGEAHVMAAGLLLFSILVLWMLNHVRAKMRVIL